MISVAILAGLALLAMIIGAEATRSETAGGGPRITRRENRRHRMVCGPGGGILFAIAAGPAGS